MTTDEIAGDLIARNPDDARHHFWKLASYARELEARLGVSTPRVDEFYGPGFRTDEDSKLFALQLETELEAAKARIAELETMLAAPKCSCDDSTGWVGIRCCNLCGLPDQSERIPWRFNTPDTKRAQ
jgi:hypothetical protein